MAITECVKVKFLATGKSITYQAPPELPRLGTPVIVPHPETGKTHLAVLATRSFPLLLENIGGRVDPILRTATEADLQQYRRNLELERQGASVFREKANHYMLEMKLVSSEVALDEARRITFFFTAEQRLDFREMLKDVSSELKAKVEFIQIGAREETKVVGGIGSCGRTLCCSTFLQNFAPITVKMAKDQDLSLATSKLSGQCGKLKCCISYEHAEYLDAKKNLPPVGATITTKAKSCGKVCGAKVLDRKVLYQIDDGVVLEVAAEDIVKVELPVRRTKQRV